MTRGESVPDVVCIGSRLASDECEAGKNSARVSDQKKFRDDITKKCKKLNLYIDSKHI